MFCRLQNLPFSLANLNLKAMWLAENQSQPMLKFQTEDDERTGEKVLTCYLLPQQPTSSLGEARPLVHETQSVLTAVSWLLYDFAIFDVFLENLLQSSVDESWPTDTNLNRVSVIQFQDQTKADEEDDETAAERKVRLGLCVASLCALICVGRFSYVLLNARRIILGYSFVFNQQGLQRRATPHPSELKVMKNVIEARRNEAYTAKPDDDLESPDTEVCILCGGDCCI